MVSRSSVTIVHKRAVLCIGPRQKRCSLKSRCVPASRSAAPQRMSRRELKRIAMVDRGSSGDAKVLEIDAALDQYDFLKGEEEVRDSLQEIMLCFLRTPTFLVWFADLSGRCDPTSGSRIRFSRKTHRTSWLRRLGSLGLPVERASDNHTKHYLEARKRLQTGSHAGPEVSSRLLRLKLRAGRADTTGGQRAPSSLGRLCRQRVTGST